MPCFGFFSGKFSHIYPYNIVSLSKNQQFSHAHYIRCNFSLYMRSLKQLKSVPKLETVMAVNDDVT